MTIISAISGALSIANSLKNLFGGGGELSEVNGKLTQILALSNQGMEGVSTVNQNAINTKLSEIKTQLDTAVSNLSDHRASGEVIFRDEAIQNSQLALAGIINHAEVIQAPKSMLVLMFQAASIFSTVSAHLRSWRKTVFWSARPRMGPFMEMQRGKFSNAEFEDLQWH